LIDALRVRNFTLCSAGTGYYAFVHRTFLEYFCATEIWERFNQRDSGSQNAISTDDLIHTIFGQHWNDDAWREVLILLASQLPIGFAKQAIASLVQLDHATSEKADFANLFLAADCLAELPERSTIAELDRDLSQRLRSLTTWGPLRGLHAQEDIDFYQRINEVRDRAVRYAAQHWKDDPDTLPWLKDCTRSDKSLKNLIVQQAAMQELAQHWKDDPNTLPWLKNCARSNEDLNMRQEAVCCIAQHWKDDPDTLPWLKDCTRSDENFFVRQAAVRELAQGWKDDRDTLPLLKDCARSDESFFVRQVAVRELAQGWKDDRDTLPLLKDRARSDQNEYVRQAAVEELAQDWKDGTDTVNLLCEVATQDPFQRDKEWQGNPRQTALEKLLEIAPKHPLVIDLLRDRAANDSDDLLRQWATEQLAEIDSQSHRA
jgi:predicted NACHT family NTPase